MHRNLRHVTGVVLAAIVLATVAGPVAARSGPDLPDEPDTPFIDFDQGAVVVYPDGRVFRRTGHPSRTQLFAPTRAGIAPLPAPSGYERAQLTDAGLAWLWRQADELGMLVDKPDYGDPPITDQATSSLVVRSDDEIFEHRVYAPDVAVDDELAQQRRGRYAEFTATLVHLDDVIDDAISAFTPWVPDAWIVSQEGWLIEAPRRTWPLERTPEPGDCVVLPSDPAEDTATGAYVFDGAREDVIVVATPALPGSACERVGAAR